MDFVTNNTSGRFGNRLFQIANAFAYSLKYNKKYFINKSFYKINNINHHSNFKEVFPNLEKLFFDLNTENFNIINENYFLLSNHEFVEGNILFNGYYQSEEYFYDYRKEILELFDFNEKIKNIVNNRWSNLLNKNTVSIHVRRGDYLYCNFPVLSLEYYNKCIELLKNRIDNIIIFSDDINWCKNNMKYDIETFYSEQSEIDDLFLMSMCKYNIIANSSFSWWGSYLNNNEDKIIYSPNKWFNYPYEKIYRKDMIIC